MLAPERRPAVALLADDAATPGPDLHMSARLLLIDDDARLTAMLGDYLRGAGFDVSAAASLAQGRMRLATQTWDALVLDLMLPDGDGLELCRELCARPETRARPLRTTSMRRRMRSLPPGQRVVTMRWSPRPAAKAPRGIFRSVE